MKRTTQYKVVEDSLLQLSVQKRTRRNEMRVWKFEQSYIVKRDLYLIFTRRPSMR